MDDGDSKNCEKIKKERIEIGFLQRYVANVGDVLSPIWLRRTIQVNNGLEWFVLGSRYRFLFYFRLFLVILYYSFQILK